MGAMKFQELHQIYQRLLMEDVVPYWLRHGIDREHGGLMTCIRDDGSRISTDKYMWSQGRGIWSFSALYNRIEKRPEFLDVARRTADFVLKHGRDKEGRFAFQLTREGEIVQGAVSVYADFFVVYGLGELYRATHEKRYMEEALRIFRSAVARVKAPDFNSFAPYTRPLGIGHVHGAVMIGLEVGQELGDVSTETDIQEFVDWCLHRIMEVHSKPERKLLLEHLGPNDEEVDSPPGRVVIPGHSIESMWFVMHQARRRKDPALARRATEMVRWILTIGWDEEFGGIFLGIDAAGGKPWWPHAEKKLWWVHGETLYALLLAHELTGEAWCMEWYKKVHDWTFQFFPDHEHGEWHQRLDREGRLSTEVVALPVKDPFHLPRNLILGLDVLSRLTEKSKETFPENT